MRTLVLASTCLLALAATAFAQDTTKPSASDTNAAPTTLIQRDDTPPPPTADSTPRAKHRMHRHAVATQHSDMTLGTEVRPRAATAMPTPGSSTLGNRSDDPAGPTTVIQH